MSKNLQLEEKLRKSEVLTEEDIYKDFMAYAQEVRDELEVYLYMQENNIGTDHTEYWLARFKVMQKQCLFSQIAELVPVVKKIAGVDMQLDYYQYESKLIKDLEFIICEPVSGRRKASSFFIDQISNIHPQKRKIGNFEVYVDEDCRKHYKLPDYASYVQQEKKDYCELQRQFYQRMQKDKPPSFLAKNQLHLIELAEQLMSKKGRNSLDMRKSMQVERLSNKVNTRQTFKDQTFNTPKVNVSNNLIKYSTNKVDRAKSRDSVEILKEMREKHITEQRSPKFGDKENHNQQHITRNEVNELNSSTTVIQHCRGVNLMQKNREEDLCFSFRKIRVSMSEKKEKQKKRNNKESCADNAFIMYSFSKQSKTQQVLGGQFVNKEDFELALLINEIQQEKYQKIDSKTFSSEIDSNQENNLYQSNYIFNNPERQVLQDLLMSPNHKKYDLQELIRQNEDSICMPEDKVPDLQCHSQQKGKNSPVFTFRSERKRLSNITEQGSYYCSDSRKKHFSRK